MMETNDKSGKTNAFSHAAGRDEELLREDPVLNRLADAYRLDAAPAGLENRVMHQIEALKSYAAQQAHPESVVTETAPLANFAPEVRLSWLFFLVGITSGMIISLLLPLVGEIIPGVSGRMLATGFQLLFAALILIQLDALVRFTRVLWAPSEHPSE